MDNILKSQAENDKRYYDLEEKRMCLEEHDKERNEQIPREKREFQLRMMNMIAQAQTPAASPSFFPGPAYIPPLYPSAQDVDDD